MLKWSAFAVRPRMDKMFETDVAERLRIVYKASALKAEDTSG